MLLNNIENKVKLLTTFVIVVCVCCTAVSAFSILAASYLVVDGNKKIFEITAMPATDLSLESSEISEAEIYSHIETFHGYFFNLVPDNKSIESSRVQFMYRADESALAQYNTLKEMGLYKNIASSGTFLNVFPDSINLNHEKMEFDFYGRLRVENKKGIEMRNLVTTGSLRRVPKTINNPHGLLIYNWRITNNDQLHYQSKSNL